MVKSIALKSNQYIVVQHIVDTNANKGHSPNDIPLTTRGKLDENDGLILDSEMQLIEIVRGPQIFSLKNPYDLVSEVKSMINLSSTQYVIVSDKLTGERKVECGPKLFCPKPYDEFKEIKSMYNLSSTEYIIVTDEASGEKNTVTGKTEQRNRHVDRTSFV